MSHSRLGIVSFIIALIAIILTAIAIPTFYNALTDMDHRIDPTEADQFAVSLTEKYPELVVGLLLIMLSSFLVVVGAIIGIISLIFSRGRKKLFPILGTVLSFMPIIVFVIAIIIRNVTAPEIIPINP